MNWFLRRFLFELFTRPLQRSIDWTKEERDAFDNFCRSSCGIKFLEYLRQVVARTTFNAVYRESVSANAYARGQQDILSTFHKLRGFPTDGEQEVASSDVPTGLPTTYHGAVDGRRFGYGSGSAIGR
jgi:hypothetical protein